MEKEGEKEEAALSASMGGRVDYDASGDGFHNVVELWEEEFALEDYFEEGKGDGLFFVCVHVDFDVVEEDSDVALEWKEGSIAF